MEYKIGDRYRHTSGLIVEVINLKGKWWHQEVVLEQGNSTAEEGTISSWVIDSDNWEYLGNFSKSDSFEELYNLFNS